MNRILLTLAIAAGLAAQTSSHPTGNRTTPPTLNSVSPQGVARGATTEISVEGLNLAKATAIYFSEPGVKGRIVRIKELPDLPDIRLGSNGTPSTIDLGPLPPRNQVTIEVEVDADAQIGPVRFRLLTPLGTSPEGQLLIEPYYGESADREPNDTPENAVEAFLPAILTGAISRPGDVDHFQIRVRAGQELVFENAASEIGSALIPVVALMDAESQLIREISAPPGETLRFVHRFAEDGVYCVRITDYQQSGRSSNTYRIRIGSFPVVTSFYPLGAQRGQQAELSLEGANLKQSRVRVAGKPDPGMLDSMQLRPAGASGPAFNTIRLAVGDEPEREARPGDRLDWPVTLNGKLTAEAPAAVFRFTAAKGQPVVLEVNARRLGSDLDSLMEVLDAAGKPVPVAIARPVMETAVTLRDHDSSGRGIRIASWTGWAPGDFILIGGEVLRVEELPKTPDEDVLFESFGGQRIAFFGTSGEAHALDKPVYKVQILPPNAKLTPNGLPAAVLYARNDDGGPGFGKDSYLVFSPPADGEYQVRLSDVRGAISRDVPYRLTVRAPRPDFRLSFSPRNPAVPVGGTIPVTVTARRMDGFQGPIEVWMSGLLADVRARPAVIPAGQTSATLLLTADAAVKWQPASPVQVHGKAQAGGVTVERSTGAADPLALVSLMPPPDLLVTAETREVEMEAGGTAEISLAITRQNQFGGRVPVRVSGLPPRVNIEGFGLNGVLINEDENRRSFVIAAAPNAAPGEYWIYVGGTVETRSPQQSAYMAPEPVKLRIKPGKAIRGGVPHPDSAAAPSRR